MKFEKVKTPYTTKVHEYETDKATEEQWNRIKHLLDQFDEETLEDMNSEEQLEKSLN